MALMVFAVGAILLLLDFIGVPLNPTIGILAYTLFPALLFFYLILILVGMYREWRRQHRAAGAIPPDFPRFDFNIKSQRMQLYFFILATSLVGLLSLAIGTRVYEMTESVEFCSNICHNVMEPEATTYENSPHARVACVQCHVGEGATWYVKSKLSGLYQVYATLFKKYPRPIETPVGNLRPSQDTCERCHWPSKFYGAKQVINKHYEENEKNTPRQFFMLLNIGGGISPTGIHWHVGDDKVDYIARDKQRQDVPWIKVRYKDGREEIYQDSGNPMSAEEMAKATPRRMDCLDCHNRPTHIFKSPRKALDEAMTAGKISTSLPYVKKLGVEVLSENYATNEEAREAIDKKVTKFYAAKYPELARSHKSDIENAVGEMINIWERNNFPHMKSNWTVYPSNIGHLTWPGCFRCHDGNHKNEKGEAIKKDCNICHLFLDEQMSGLMTQNIHMGKPFKHPVDVGGEEKKSSCSSCHAGR